ncbi:MAG: DUF89 family protein [Candidatus Eisenbacteria sp.]|nr:DUF89 family protein [Candidatus Eisenbacteria bacterium]
MRSPADWRSWVPTPAGEPFALTDEFPAQPGLWDLEHEPAVIPHWNAILRSNADYVRELLDTEEAAARGERALEPLRGLLADLEAGRATDAVRTIHEVTLVRDHLLRAHGLEDPYAQVKAQEARRLQPAAATALEEAWARGARAPRTADLAGILGDLLAGNLFDLGSRTTQEAFRRGALDIAASRRTYRRAAAAWLAGAGRPAQPWLLGPPVPLAAPPRGRMLFFADNAGADFLLGVLPAALHLARRWEVVLVVNSQPASSDICFAEAEGLCAHFAEQPGSALAEARRAGRLRLAASGTGAPGIDLRFVAAELNELARDADWLLLEGQGRAVETNWRTTFRCPVLRVAVVKDTLVAETIGVEPRAALLRWDEPALTAPSR